MEYIIPSVLIFLITIMSVIMMTNKGVGATVQNFLFANRRLTTVRSGLAISSHWFWAIAIFVGPAVAYNWGLIGLLWFAIPNAFSCIIVGYLALQVRKNYPEGYSLTAYIKNNYSRRVSALFQLEFVLLTLAALLLAFTAINKLWVFSSLSLVIQPVYFSLIVGLITLAFTIKGGIRTSIFTGSLQTMLWLVFIAVAISFVPTVSFDNLSGKNSLTTVFNEKFLTTFAVPFLITILVGATSHGMMWQKAFSMPRESIMPAFAIGGLAFLIMVLGLGFLSLQAFATGLEIKTADTSQISMILTALGTLGVVIFATILIGQTSTVIDSALNYIASLGTLEWLRQDNVTTSRIVMTAFLLLAWAISWAKLEIWTILMLMSAVRIVMFVPLIMHIFKFRLNEGAVFYTSIVSILISLYFAWTAKFNSMPINDMYAALTALCIPVIVYTALHLKSQLRLNI
jgi:urea-proton symporter